MLRVNDLNLTRDVWKCVPMISVRKHLLDVSLRNPAGLKSKVWSKEGGLRTQGPWCRKVYSESHRLLLDHNYLSSARLAPAAAPTACEPQLTRVSLETTFLPLEANSGLLLLFKLLLLVLLQVLLEEGSEWAMSRSAGLSASWCPVPGLSDLM